MKALQKAQLHCALSVYHFTIQYCIMCPLNPFAHKILALALIDSFQTNIFVTGRSSDPTYQNLRLEVTKASRGGGNRGQCLCVRGGKIGKIIFNAHPYHPVAFRWILPGTVWLDRTAGVVLGGGKLC